MQLAPIDIGQLTYIEFPQVRACSRGSQPLSPSRSGRPLTENWPGPAITKHPLSTNLFKFIPNDFAFLSTHQPL